MYYGFKLYQGSKDSTNIQIHLKYASNKIDVYEETLMSDETSLVGSLGRSLGLFVGFSFFGYAMQSILKSRFYCFLDFNLNFLL